MNRIEAVGKGYTVAEARKNALDIIDKVLGEEYVRSYDVVWGLLFCEDYVEVVTGSGMMSHTAGVWTIYATVDFAQKRDTE